MDKRIENHIIQQYYDNQSLYRSLKHDITDIIENIITKNNPQKLNSSIPCIAWGNTAKELSKAAVNDVISIKGEIHSREYKKYISDTDVEIRVAHEVVAIDFKYTVD